MIKKTLIRLGSFFVFFVILFSVIIINNNYLLKNSKGTEIYPVNYRQLPQIIEVLASSETLIPVQNYKYFYGNNKVKKIESYDNQVVANLYFFEREDEALKRSAELVYDFKEPIDLEGKLIITTVATKGNVTGKGFQGSRIQIELIDNHGKPARGPRIPLSQSGEKNYIAIRPTATEPIPLGSSHPTFNPRKVQKLILRLVIARYDAIKLPTQGKIFIDEIYTIKNSDKLSILFGTPDTSRITKDNFIIRYELNKRKWKQDKEDFFVGINYPWRNYGWDIGKNPYGEVENGGWSSKEGKNKLKKDFAFFKTHGINPVRIYIFFDLRTGLNYQDGKLIGFDSYVRKDIESLLKIAGESSIKIIPVLFDFRIADGISQNVGEHPELIFSHQDKYNFLKNLMIPLLRDMDRWNEMYGKPIYALELINEPENVIALILPDYYRSLKIWLQDLVNIIHNETSFRVTLGSYTIDDMPKWWQNINIDTWQFHFYKDTASGPEQQPQRTKRGSIKIDGSIFLGEFEPYDIEENINAIKENGYNGIIFWAWNSTDGYRLESSREMEEILEWLDKLKEAKNP